MTPNVSLRQLRVFLAVSEHASFSRAGEAIGLTQPAVSRAIRELESELGLTLLDRTTREVSLTAEGRALVGEVGRLIDELETALRQARTRSEARSGRVRVACAPTISASLMPATIAAAAQRYPQIELVLHDLVQRLVLESVRSGEVDFAVIVNPISASDLVVQTVMTDHFYLVCPNAHRLAKAARVKWTQLEGESLVLLDYNSGSRPLIDRALAQHGVQYRVAQEVGHSTTVFRLLEAGIGVSVQPGLSLPLPGDTLVARPLVPDVTRPIMLARRRNRSLSPAAQVMWDLVLDTARHMAPPVLR
ncbi:MAG: LysR family transcriptional regulator [Rhodocyclaceae bacterium]